MGSSDRMQSCNKDLIDESNLGIEVLLHALQIDVWMSIIYEFEFYPDNLKAWKFNITPNLRIYKVGINDYVYPDNPLLWVE